MPHPFVAAVARDCVHEAPEMFARQRDLYEIMESLDARRGMLSESCRQTAFEGNAASRSAEGASWYAQKCGGDVLTTKGLSELVTKLTTSMDQMITFLRRQKPPHYQNGTWPTGFQMLPGIVFLILQNPCIFAYPRSQGSAFGQLSIFYLIRLWTSRANGRSTRRPRKLQPLLQTKPSPQA